MIGHVQMNSQLTNANTAGKILKAPFKFYFISASLIKNRKVLLTRLPEPDIVYAFYINFRDVTQPQQILLSCP